MKNTILLFMAAASLALIWSCQEKPKKEAGSDLLPGEVRVPGYPVPIITSVEDTSCSESTDCPSKEAECVTRDFTVQKDTIYYLTVRYDNGDTIHASCRACGTVYQGNTIVMHRLTACPTGGPWVDFGNLKSGITYTLSVCLQRCPDTQKCDCGKYAFAEAVVSIRRVSD
jgi:hypothetical protein